MNRAPRQLLLDLSHREALGREDFLVAPNNAEAVALIDLWPNWASPCAVIYGAKGCGKTHLLNVFKKKSGAIEMTHAQLVTSGLPDIIGAAAVVAIDDADKVAGLTDKEEALFHLYNLMKEQGGHVLLTSELAPKHWPFTLKDLSSRVIAAPAAGIGLPDDAMMAAVLLKLFSDRQIRISDEVITYLTSRMTRSFDAAKKIVSAIDALSLEEKRSVTVALAKRALDGR